MVGKYKDGEFARFELAIVVAKKNAMILKKNN